MKQQETTEVALSGATFYIRPFAAFTAANLSGELIRTLSPMLAVLAGEESVLDAPLEEALPKISGALSGLSGDELEKLIRRLLIDHRNVSVVSEELTGGAVKALDMSLANELFCLELQDMYRLCWEVVRLNFGGFFRRLAAPSGGQSGPSDQTAARSDTAPSI